MSSLHPIGERPARRVSPAASAAQTHRGLATGDARDPAPTVGRPRRRGMSLLEVIAASSLLGAAMAMIPPLVGRLTLHRQSLDQQQWAVAELDNVLEDLSARPPEEVTPESVARLELSPAARDRLPDAALAVSLSPAETAPTARKITATLRWSTPARTTRVVTLCAWIHGEGR